MREVKRRTWKQIRVLKQSRWIIRAAAGVGVFALALTTAAPNAFGGTTKPRLHTALEEIARLVERHNLDVRLARLDYEIALAEVAAGEVDFETLVTFRPEYRSERQLSNSTLESYSYLETTGSLSAGLKRKFSLGTQAEAVIQEMWLASDAQQATFGNRDQAALQLKVTQPFLKGRGPVTL